MVSDSPDGTEKIHNLEESLVKAEENVKNQEEKYHKNIQVSHDFSYDII